MPTSPTSSHGGGSFNGGTITTPLLVRPNTGASPLFLVQQALPNVQTALTLNNAGALKLDDPTEAGVVSTLTLAQSGTDAAKTELISNGQVLANADSGEIALGKTNGSIYFFDVFDGLFGFTQNAVPPDGNFDNNGMCALWLDATPGATKLMVKAKDSAGTFRTAAIALA